LILKNLIRTPLKCFLFTADGVNFREVTLFPFDNARASKRYRDIKNKHSYRARCHSCSTIRAEHWRGSACIHPARLVNHTYAGRITPFSVHAASIPLALSRPSSFSLQSLPCPPFLRQWRSVTWRRYTVLFHDFVFRSAQFTLSRRRSR